MTEPRPPLAGELDRFREEVARPRSERLLTGQHSTYLVRHELEKGDLSFHDLLQAVRAIRPEITREYLREMLDLGVRDQVIGHLPDNTWHWKGKPQPLSEQIDRLGAGDTARLRAWLAGPNGSLRLSPWLVIEAVEGGGLMIRTRKRVSNG